MKNRVSWQNAAISLSGRLSAFSAPQGKRGPWGWQSAYLRLWKCRKSANFRLRICYPFVTPPIPLLFPSYFSPISGLSRSGDLYFRRRCENKSKTWKYELFTIPVRYVCWFLNSFLGKRVGRAGTGQSECVSSNRGSPHGFSHPNPFHFLLNEAHVQRG